MKGCIGEKEIADMEEYIKEVRPQFKHFIWILGNHDVGFELLPNLAEELAQRTDSIYLNEKAAEVEGIKFYGSNYVPEVGCWSFMYKRGTTRWNAIPKDTQILITHTGAYGVLDGVPRHDGSVEHVGCWDLGNTIMGLRKLKFHLHGHGHEGYGSFKLDRVKVYNCSIMDEFYFPRNRPHYFEVEDIVTGKQIGRAHV